LPRSVDAAIAVRRPAKPAPHTVAIAHWRVW